MLYELRVYEITPGKMPAFHARFENHVLKYFDKHGINVIGLWTTLVGESNNEVSYILAFENMADREKRYAAFSTDPEWLAARRESEKDGVPLVARIRNQFLAPTSYSPLK
jgi:NIPSNAP protein